MYWGSELEPSNGTLYDRKFSGGVALFSVFDGSDVASHILTKLHPEGFKPSLQLAALPQCARFLFGAIAGATMGKVPDVRLLTSMRMRACRLASEWGTLSATYTGFTSASTVFRGRYIFIDTATKCHSVDHCGKPSHGTLGVVFSNICLHASTTYTYYMHSSRSNFGI